MPVLEIVRCTRILAPGDRPLPRVAIDADSCLSSPLPPVFVLEVPVLEAEEILPLVDLQPDVNESIPWELSRSSWTDDEADTDILPVDQRLQIKPMTEMLADRWLGQ